MALQSDADGFLVGDVIPDIKRMSKGMESIRKDVAMIKNYLKMSVDKQNRPPLPNNENSQRQRDSSRSSSERRATVEPRQRNSRGRFTRDTANQNSNTDQTQVDRIRRTQNEINETQARTEQERQRTERQRDANGRFTSDRTRQATAEPNGRKRNAKGQFEGSADKSFLSNAFDSLGDKITAGIQLGTGGLEEVDPTVKAFQEVAEPLSRGYQFLFGGTDKKDKPYFDWFKKIWKTLKKTEANTEENNSESGGGFFSSLITGLMGGGLFAILGSILAFIFSPIALGIGAAGIAAWGLFTKSGNRFFAGLTDSLVSTWQDSVNWTVDNVFQPIGDAFNAVETAISKTWNDTIAKVSDMFEAMGKRWDDVVTGAKALLDKFVINPVKNLYQAGKDIRQNAIDNTSQNIEAGVNKAASIKEKVIIGATDAIESTVNAAGAVKDKTVDYASRNIIEPVGDLSKAAKQKWNDKRTNARWQEAKPLIADAAKKADVDPAILAKISGFESGFNSEAMPITRSGKKISSAHGYGQFLDGTWDSSIKKYGAKYGLDVNNPRKYRHDKTVQANMLAEFTKENLVKGRKHGGTDDAANVYAMHNLGEGDGPKFLKALKENPNAPVSSVLSGRVIKGNGSLYKNGSITLAEAYANMGKAMSGSNAFANDIKNDGELKNQNKQVSPVFKATANQQQIEKATAKPTLPTQVATPPTPAMPTMPKPQPIPEMPLLTIPMASDKRGSQQPIVIQEQIGQDLPDRALAHIAAPFLRK